MLKSLDEAIERCYEVAEKNQLCADISVSERAKVNPKSVVGWWELPERAVSE